MQLVDFLFSIARKVTDGNLDKVNQLHRRAEDETSKYATTDKGFKGMYARLHSGWIFGLVLILLEPIATAYFHNLKNRIANQQLGFDQESLDYENDDFQNVMNS